MKKGDFLRLPLQLATRLAVWATTAAPTPPPASFQGSPTNSLVSLPVRLKFSRRRTAGARQLHENNSRSPCRCQQGTSTLARYDPDRARDAPVIAERRHLCGILSALSSGLSGGLWPDNVNYRRSLGVRPSPASKIG